MNQQAGCPFTSAAPSGAGAITPNSLVSLVIPALGGAASAGGTVTQIEDNLFAANGELVISMGSIDGPFEVVQNWSIKFQSTADCIWTIEFMFVDEGTSDGGPQFSYVNIPSTVGSGRGDGAVITYNTPDGSIVQYYQNQTTSGPAQLIFDVQINIAPDPNQYVFSVAS